MKLSVVMVTAGREALFRRTLCSVLIDLPESSEVRVVVNGDHPGTLRWLEGLADPRLSFLTVPNESRCQARNRAISATTGEILYVFDDDVIVPRGLFRLVIDRFDSDAGLGVLGGPNLTPPDTKGLARLCGAIMASAFATPRVRFRYGAGSARRFVATEHHLILCNLALRRSEFAKSQGFFPNLRSNEENLLLHQLSHIGTRLEFDRDAFVYHERRGTLTGFVRQIHSYGVGRGQQTFLAPSSFSWMFAIPSIALLVGAALGVWAPVILAELLIIHALASVLSAAICCETRRLGIGLLASIPLTLLIHFTYGCGVIQGLVGMALSPKKARRGRPSELTAPQMIMTSCR
ncbi:MAG: glycosyltransferase [Deltaproteobacteria bacterium]|nr:glycosyltransferase [Deltaproteobacteria bacterium]MBI3296289.1 glycosyltransferase [Deltaproteobacteria bacterium]